MFATVCNFLTWKGFFFQLLKLHNVEILESQESSINAESLKVD